jgi:hypothetical protein
MKWLMVSNVYSMDTQDKGMVHVLGKVEQDGARLYHATHNGI